MGKGNSEIAFFFSYQAVQADITLIIFYYV